MAKLVYAPITSLDGYTVDSEGNFQWAAPDPEVHAFVNDVERGFGTYLLGRRMYETMVYWENPDLAADPSPVARDFAALWRDAEKVVYSRSLKEVTTARTRLEGTFDLEQVRQLKETAGHDISIGGSELARQAMAAGLVDELHLFLTPVVVGSGTATLPDGFRCDLELLGLDRFDGGVVHLHYRINN